MGGHAFPMPASLNRKRELVIGITKHASLLADQADEIRLYNKSIFEHA
jgi:hypothetical protein